MRRTGKPVLLIQHAQNEHPAVLKRALDALGVPHIWLHPYRGDQYPSINEIGGVLSLGGSMGANDEAVHPWITQECTIIRQSVEASLPTVGVCLGAQMMAKALGGHVEKHSSPEVGWFEIQLNEAGRQDLLLGNVGLSPLVYQWHYDTFHLPPSATLLAGSVQCARQAYRISDHAYGFQFHPEADHQLVGEWLGATGIGGELAQEASAFGAHAVQLADYQMRTSFLGERSSVKITASIAQHFCEQAFVPQPSRMMQNLIDWAEHRTILMVEIMDARGQALALKGYIASLLSMPSGDFAIFREENRILWPIRLDRIVRVMLG